MSHRSRLATLLLGAVVAATAGTANAQVNRCSAAKILCAAKKVQGLLLCHGRAESNGAAVDQTCIDKVKAKFSTPLAGCMEKAEKSPPCLAGTGDAAAMEMKVDDFVHLVVMQLDPGYPAPVRNRCSAGKKQCIARKTLQVLRCHQKAHLTGGLVDPACVAKAKATYDGGADPAKGCFAKLEAKPPCLSTGDSAAGETKVDDFVNDVVGELVPRCGDGILAAGEACDDGGNHGCDGCKGDCSRFDDVCGDGIIECGEDCDTGGVDTAGCNGGICTAPSCGDGHVNAAAGELCDPPGSTFGSGPPGDNGLCDACQSPSGAFLQGAF